MSENATEQGKITVEYNGYPKGLPDSGFVYEAAYKSVECDLCAGEGYTREEYLDTFKLKMDLKLLNITDRQTISSAQT